MIARLERPALVLLRARPAEKARERRRGLRAGACEWRPGACPHAGCGGCGRGCAHADGGEWRAFGVAFSSRGRWLGWLRVEASRRNWRRESQGTAEKDIPRPGVLRVCGGCGVRGTSPRDLAWPASDASRVLLGYHSSQGRSRAFGPACLRARWKSCARREIEWPRAEFENPRGYGKNSDHVQGAGPPNAKAPSSGAIACGVRSVVCGGLWLRRRKRQWQRPE